MNSNKPLLALAIASLTATSVSASEIYNDGKNSIQMGGRAEARASVMDGEFEDRSRIRLNFLGKAELANGFYGIGFYEGEFTTNEQGQATDTDADNLTNRYAYAGFGSLFGEVTYGKNEGALGVITDFTDIMAYHGNSAAYKIAIADRTDNMLTYTGKFGGLGVKGSYRFADRITEDVTGKLDKFDNNDADGYSLSTTYAFDIDEFGINLGLGYADGNEFDEQGYVIERDQFMLAGSVAFRDFYFAAAYVDGEDKNRTLRQASDLSGYEVAASYTLNKAVFTATYNYLEEKNKYTGEKSDAADNIAIDATYYFQPNFRGYISYNFNNLSDSDVQYKWQKEDELALGIRYDF